MSTETKDAEPELQVKESVDGSAVVDLPDNFIEGDETDPAPAPKEAPQEASAADDDDQDRDDDASGAKDADMHEYVKAKNSQKYSLYSDFV